MNAAVTLSLQPGSCQPALQRFPRKRQRILVDVGLPAFNGGLHHRPYLPVQPFHAQAAPAGQVVEVSASLWIGRLLAWREDGQQHAAARQAGRFLRLGLTGVDALLCFQVLVVIAGDDHRLGRKTAVQRLGHQRQVARVEGRDGGEAE